MDSEESKFDDCKLCANGTKQFTNLSSVQWRPELTWRFPRATIHDIFLILILRKRNILNFPRDVVYYIIEVLCRSDTPQYSDVCDDCALRLHNAPLCDLCDTWDTDINVSKRYIPILTKSVVTARIIDHHCDEIKSTDDSSGCTEYSNEGNPIGHTDYTDHTEHTEYTKYAIHCIEIIIPVKSRLNFLGQLHIVHRDKTFDTEHKIHPIQVDDHVVVRNFYLNSCVECGESVNICTYHDENKTESQRIIFKTFDTTDGFKNFKKTTVINDIRCKNCRKLRRCHKCKRCTGECEISGLRYICRQCMVVPHSNKNLYHVSRFSQEYQYNI